jgi:transcriptional regulator with XRE-family HTH domain
LGAKLRVSRELAGLSEVAAAGALGINPALLSRYEAGEYTVPLAVLAAMSNIYQVGLGRSGLSSVAPCPRQEIAGGAAVLFGAACTVCKIGKRNGGGFAWLRQ